jgi:hypothetical protein
MTGDVSIPTGVTRRREPVGRSSRFRVPHTPGPYRLTVGHLAAFSITDEAAHRQFGMLYHSAGLAVWGSGFGDRVAEVLAADPRGWWVYLNDRRAALVRPEDLLGAVDLGPDDTQPTPTAGSVPWMVDVPVGALL